VAAHHDIPSWKVWLARAAVLLVFGWNVLCALQFFLVPGDYAPAYGLAVTPENEALVAGLGVAFLMWNVTYPAVIANPVKFKALFVVVLVQQLVGLVGESVIWFRLSDASLASSAIADGIMRFVLFDGAGLVLMLVAFCVLRNSFGKR